MQTERIEYTTEEAKTITPKMRRLIKDTNASAAARKNLANHA